MVKKRKAVPVGGPPLKSRRQARRITTSFHQLTKELDEVLREESCDQDDGRRRREKIKHLEAQIENMGGRKVYQDASILSTSFHKTSKWVFSRLEHLGLRPRPKLGQLPLRVLEVGAINTQLLNCPWMNVHAIDLQSRHDRIHQCDFFTFATPRAEYDVLVSSMVINCVPDPLERGKMLRMYFEHVQPGGHVFLMLPLLCLTRSKHMQMQDFVHLLTQKLTFRLIETKTSPKVAFFCLQRPPRSSDTTGIPLKSKSLTGVTKKAKKRKVGSNEFHVLLPRIDGGA